MRHVLSIFAAGVLTAWTAVPQEMGAAPHPLGTPAPASQQQVMVVQQSAAPHSRGDNFNARRATDALNLLESHGYAAFWNFKTEGNHFVVTATDNGATFEVIVNPDTGDVSGR